MFYPFYYNEREDKVRIPKMEFDEITQQYNIFEEPSSDETIIYPIKDDFSEGCWYFGLERALTVANEFKVKKENNFYKLYYRRRPNEGVQPTSLWFDAKYSATEHGTALLKSLFGTQDIFSYPKSIYAVIDCLSVAGMNISKNTQVLDYFAGSGTTAHATIALNREDNGNRKYILIEQGEYFNTVIKPRIQKVIYSENWKDGKPALPKDTKTVNEANRYNGISHCLKVIKLESYEDTLNNLELRRTGQQQQLFDSMNNAQKDDYLMHYLLDIESKGSLLSVADFAKPFDYQLKITSDSAGAYTTQPIDLIDTFNYLIGLNVQHIDYQLERGYVFIEGTLRTGEKTLVFWRDTSVIGYEKLEKTLLERLKVNPKDREYQLIYLNGDHNIPSPFIHTEDGERKLKIRSIEQTFFDKMFEE